MTRRRSRMLVTLVVASFLAGACADDGRSRAEVVGEQTAAVVPERFEVLDEAAETLARDVAVWCEAGVPDVDDEAVVAGVATVRERWQALAPYWFGPAMDRRSRAIIDPDARSDDVAELLAASVPLDPATLRDSYGADQRGLGAIALLVERAATTPDGGRVCEYAAATADLVHEETSALVDEWRAYGPALDDDDQTANEALGGIVNETLFALDRLDMEDRRDVATAMASGIGDALAGLSPLLSDDVVGRLEDEIDTVRRSVGTARLGDAVDELETTLATNVVSSLGLSIQFSDADGDG